MLGALTLACGTISSVPIQTDTIEGARQVDAHSMFITAASSLVTLIYICESELGLNILHQYTATGQ